MRKSNLGSGIVLGMAFLASGILCFGCGNPEAPRIENVKLFSWDYLAGKGAWQSIEDGGIAPASPVRVQGNVTDNTAVVSPRIAWIGERGDMREIGFTGCSDGTNGAYECEMDCVEVQGGFFECGPLLPARKLIRGDRFSLKLATTAGETFELEVRVSEFFVPQSRSDPDRRERDYRIFKIFSLKGDFNPFLWSLFQRKRAGGPWLPLRSGDVLDLASGDNAFQFAIQVPEGVELETPPTATWRSLVKWNNDSSLNWDAATGLFIHEFQIFDPRDEHERSRGTGAPTYRFLISAQDVPDQKTGVYRYSEKEVGLLFHPEEFAQGIPPELEVVGEEEETVATSQPADNVPGSVLSFSGEVRSLLFTLYDSNPDENREARASPVLYFDPDLISLTGKFTATIVYVSDWDMAGVVNDYEEDGGILNFLEVEALDVLGNRARTNVSIVFTPSKKADVAPEIQLREIFPTMPDKGPALLPFGEEVRLRVRVADDRGQPLVSCLTCECDAEGPLINANRCWCMEVDSGDANAGGDFPPNPWEWSAFRPVSETRQSFVVMKATEKVERRKDLSRAKFSAIEIGLVPQAEEEVYEVSVSSLVALGPSVRLTNLKGGELIADPDNLILQAIMFSNVSKLNRITALWNGEPRGQPTFDPNTGAFVWDLRGFSVKEGDRICVGAVSVTGHATLNLLEFANTSEGLLVGVTVTSVEDDCT